MSVRNETTDVVLFGSKTQKRSMEFDHVWEIYDLSSSCNYESPIYSLDRSKTIAFYLKLAGSTACATLCFLPCKVPEISLNLTLSLRNNGGVQDIKRKTLGPQDFKIQSCTSIREFRLTGSFMDSGYHQFNGDSFRLQSHYPDKYLHITCKFQMNFSVSLSWVIPRIKVPRCVILEKLSKLFENPEYSDVIFEVCGQEIHAHKIILSMHSPVFAMMFEHEMQEKLQNRVNITDIEANVFREMLRYIYTGEVEDIDEIGEKLLPVAEKYNLARLKTMCEEALQVSLTDENAASTLVLADRYNAKLLKARTAQFIHLNIREVINTEGYEAMTKSNPILMDEVLRVSAGKFLP